MQVPVLRRGDSIVITEHQEDINLLGDFFSVCQKTRESYYFLSSMHSLFQTQLWSSKVAKPADTADIEGRITALLERFRALDRSVVGEKNREDYVVDDKLVPLDAMRETGPLELLDLVTRNLELNAEMGKMQVQALALMSSNVEETIEALSSTQPLLQSLSIYSRARLSMNSGFSHSADEDKVVTYSLACSDPDFAKEFAAKGITLPQHVKVRDYGFQVRKRRRLFRLAYDSLFQMLSLIPQVEQQEYLKTLDEKQASYNRQVTVLTYLMTVLTVIMLSDGHGLLDLLARLRSMAERLAITARVWLDIILSFR